ncbi:MAG: uroporphyrinogen-III C-methyltransferase [Actinomycetia bacterium]|nr:uroporphyrinogen-III C-methyltransferase [Actinomycetes bacterium]
MSQADHDRLGVFLDLSGREVLVVGGGTVAARRIDQFRHCGARVSVVAPDVTDHIATLAVDGLIRWLPHQYTTQDLLTPADVSAPNRASAPESANGHSPQYWLVNTATGTDADQQVADDAQAHGIWCIRSDSGVRAAAVIGASARAADGVGVAVSSADPGRSKQLATAIGTALSDGSLPIRPQRSSGHGWVALVGGGPGDPGLLTVRGRQLLGMADVVVTDRLGPTAVLDELADVHVIDVGKTAGHHPVPQDQINEILVEHARLGLRVVRLKGGDPFVLGRGAEEAEYCLRHQVAVEWVPGVTSAVSVPAAAGIPVTHRGSSPAFLVASGHEASEAAAATPPETTLLLLMGVHHLPKTADFLAAEGRPGHTPVAIVENGWTPQQRTVRSTLAECGALATAGAIKAPAIIVIGPAAALSDVLGDVAAVVPR